MKKYLITMLTFIILANRVPPIYAQDQKPVMMFRVFDDNDFLNDRGKGTDDAYTNGTGLNLFYDKAHPSTFFLDRWMPKAGDSSINTFGLGLMHVMYTPSDITSHYYQPNDYPWSAALYATHTLYSYNPEKKYGLLTELVAGVMGPDALAKTFQSTVHQLIGDATPKGWDNQFGNDVLLNVNVTAEKELMHFRGYFEIIGSGQVSVGTMSDAFDVGPTFIIGIMNPYFNGYMGHASATGAKKVQVYFKYKPGLQLVAWNSLLEGGMFDRNYTVKVQENIADVNGDKIVDEYVKAPHPQIENLVTYTSYALMVVYGRLSLSYAQMHNSELVKDTYSHTYGTLSTTYSF